MGVTTPRTSCVCSPTTVATTVDPLLHEYESCAKSSETHAESFGVAEVPTEDDRWPLVTAAVALTNCFQMLCSCLFRLISTPIILCVIFCSVLADEWNAQRNRWRSWKNSYTYFAMAHAHTGRGPSAFLPLLWMERELQSSAARQRVQRRWSCLYPGCPTETEPIKWWVRPERQYGSDNFFVLGLNRRLSRAEVCALLVEKWVLRNVLFRSVVSETDGRTEWLCLSTTGDCSFDIDDHVFECENARTAADLLAESRARDLPPDLPLWHCFFCHSVAPGTEAHLNTEPRISCEESSDVECVRQASSEDITLMVFRTHSSLGDKEVLADSIGTSLLWPETVGERPLLVMLASVALLTLLTISELVDMGLVTLRAMFFAACATADRYASLFAY